VRLLNVFSQIYSYDMLYILCLCALRVDETEISCVCVFMCAYVCLCMCMCVYVHVRVHACLCVNVCMYACIFFKYIFIRHAPLQKSNTICFIVHLCNFFVIGDAVTNTVSGFPLHLHLHYFEHLNTEGVSRTKDIQYLRPLQ